MSIPGTRDFHHGLLGGEDVILVLHDQAAGSVENRYLRALKTVGLAR